MPHYLQRYGSAHWCAGERWGETAGSRALQSPPALILKQQLAQGPPRSAHLPSWAAEVMHVTLRTRQGPFLIKRVYKERVK